MVRSSVAVLAITLLAPHGITWADEPRLTGTSPLGVQRGLATEVRFQGSELADSPRLVAPFDFRIVESSKGRPDKAVWTASLTVDAKVPVGIYPIRVVTDSGVSNPILFAVGQLPQIREAESNNSLDTAQPIPNPVVIEGECSGNDQDFFRFKGRKGERIVVDAVCSRIGSGVDPMIRLTTANRLLVASADDTPGLFTDGYLTATLPEDGDYLLEFCDSRFAGTGRAVYRLLIGAVPFAGEVYPLSVPRGRDTALEVRGGTLSGDRRFAIRTPDDPLLSVFYPSIPARSLGDPAWGSSDLDLEYPSPVLLGSNPAVAESTDPARKMSAVSPPVALMGRLSRVGERDEFTIKAPAGSKYEVRVEAWGLGSALDGQLRVFGKGGVLLGESDDGRSVGGRRGGGGGGGRVPGPASTDPAFDLTIPDGQSEVKLVVRDLMDRGGIGYTYRVMVEPVATTFQLAFEDEQVAIPRGGLALIPVTATRGGYKGPISLELLGIPSKGGVTVLTGNIPAGQSSGFIGLKAAGDGVFEPREVQVLGKGEDGRTVAASKTVVFGRQTISAAGFGMGGTITSYTRPVISLTSAVVKPGPILLKHAGSKVVIPLGSTIEVPIQAVRTTKDKNKYKLAALFPPPGLEVAETEIGTSEAGPVVKFTALADASPGRHRIGLVARSSASPSAATPARKGAATPPPSSPAVAAEIIEVEVVHPASLELASKEVVLQQGGMAVLKGKINRVAPFTQEVEVRLDALPAGVKVDAIKVASGVSDFTATFKAGSGVKLAEVRASAVPVFKIGGKSHDGPPSPLLLKFRDGK